jgi:hypothetical protein
MTIALRNTLSCAVLLVLAVSSSAARAQEQVDGPTALIITYRAKPDSRAEFRDLMKSEGLAQFDRWQQQGVFASYSALFTSYAAAGAPDMFLILRFNHFTDLGAWQKIDEHYPGGLTAKELSIAKAETAATADIVSEDSKSPLTEASQFLVVEYDVTADMATYLSYVQGYVIPQFREWMKDGALSSFACYANQNPAGAPWSSLIVLEYKDLKALAARDVIKSSARSHLAATDPVWKKWSENKASIRVEKAAIPARSLR